MIASLYAGISGLSAQATAMTVIGDNIANVNTTAFKSNSSHFANILSNSLGGESATSGVGRGVEFWGASAQWTQGSLENSANSTDLAINGKGFFMVEDVSGSRFYTRAGSFSFDKEGYLVNPDGLKLQGYQLDRNGNIGSITDIYVPGERISPPSATTEFNFDINLSSTAVAGDTYTTSQTVYDSLGNAVPMTLTFTRQAAARTWAVTGSIPTTAGTGVTFGGAASTNIVFDASGAMITPAADVTVALALTNGATTPLSLTWDFYNGDRQPRRCHRVLLHLGHDLPVPGRVPGGQPAQHRGVRGGDRHGDLQQRRDDPALPGEPGGFPELRRLDQDGPQPLRGVARTPGRPCPASWATAGSAASRRAASRCPTSTWPRSS